MSEDASCTEHKRLAAVLACAILDTPREPAFDSIVFTAAQLFRVPMAMLAVVDRDRVWLKASVGRLPRSTPRAEAFCNSVVVLDNLIIVEDTLTDTRFSNPPFRAEPDIRFYAGAPLHGPANLPVGTLCVLDTTPRTVPDRARAQLLQLAREAEILLRQRTQSFDLPYA